MYYVIKGGIVIAIFITAIMYQIALTPYSFQMDYNFGNRYLANLLVHVISPLLVTLDYFLFDYKFSYNKYKLNKQKSETLYALNLIVKHSKYPFFSPFLKL